jgi:uncharacterized protein
VPGGTRALRLNTVELLRQPGLRREIDTTVDPTDLEVTDERLVGPVGVSLLAESTVDGIVVTGSVSVGWADECRRCLVPIDRVEALEVDELYQDQVVDDEAFEIGRDALDLTPTVRDAVVLSLADPPPLCRDDCAGICSVCGVDRNSGACDCDTEVRDERWAALEGLDVPEAPRLRDDDEHRGGN